MSKQSLFIDAGHGGKDSGAVGPGGLREKDVALSVALLLGSILTGSVDVFYSRKDDTFIELSQRAAMANNLGADLFISIHCNSAESAAQGFEVYTTPGQTKADAFATELFLAFGREFPNNARRIDTSDGDPDKEANFAVLRLSHMPAALFELEFISAVDGSSFLESTQMQARCAKALAAGVLSHLGLTKATEEPAAATAAGAGTAESILADFLAEAKKHSAEIKELAAAAEIHLDTMMADAGRIAEKIRALANK